MKIYRMIPSLAFLATGIIVSLNGALLPLIAQSLNVPSSTIGYALTLFTLGNFLTIFVNGFILERTSLKKQLISGLIIIILGLFAIFFRQNIATFCIGIFCIGTGLGIFISVSNFLIMKWYSNKERSIKLNLVNFVFSFGSIGFPFIAAAMIAMNFKWSWIYATILPVLILMGLSLWLWKPVILQKKNKGTDIRTVKPGIISIIPAGIGLFFYVTAEFIMGTWISSYGHHVHLIPLEKAGMLVSMFWFFIAAGRLINSKLLKILDVRVYILGTCLLAALGAAFITNTSIPLFLSIAITGYGLSGLYPSIISYSTQLRGASSAKWMTFIITMGGAGSIISMPFSSYTEKIYGISTAMKLPFVLICCMFLFLVISIFATIKDKQLFDK